MNEPQTMTPQGRETLNDILAQFKNGAITQQDSAAELIIQLFRREPINYKRVYSDKLGGSTQG